MCLRGIRKTHMQRFRKICLSTGSSLAAFTGLRADTNFLRENTGNRKPVFRHILCSEG